MKTIKNKVAALVLSIALASILLLGAASGIGIWNMRQNAVDSLQNLYTQAAEDATTALRTQKQEELEALAENKSSLADTSLSLILNQTRLVATAAAELYSHPDQYPQENGNLTTDTFNFSCNYPAETIGRFSIHLRAPRSLLDPDSIVEETGTVTKAELDETRLTEAMRRELYLARYLEGVLGGIRNFDNGDGTYNGIGATYFCLESSGIDVLADTLTTSMVEYDARQQTWYKEAKKLKKGEVYWTNPVQDGSGRGTALICAMPVYVGDRLVGVAGSGGLIDNIRELVQSTTIGDNGYAFLVSTATGGGMNIIASADKDAQSELNLHHDNLLEIDNAGLLSALESVARKESGIVQVTLDGKDSYLAYSPLHVTDWAIVTVIGLDDASIVSPIHALKDNLDTITQNTIRDMNAKILLIVFVFLGIALAVTLLIVLLSYKFSKRLAGPILHLTEGARRISGGDLDFKIQLESNDETAVLGQAFNHMTESLKEYIDNLSRVTAEKERIGAELHVATQIQASMLPCIFPAFPSRKEFDIFATMEPAKEVGGDFYDFFLIDDDHLAVVIADVSGKGVPAALFMVIAKTLIKNHAQLGLSPAQVFTQTNAQLCENNEAGLFVTAWMGILEISTGRFTYVNAGHNPPLLKRRDAEFAYLKCRPGFVLAGMEGIQYKEFETELYGGDVLYLYTDGVTEATDADNQLYGEQRLQNVLNENDGLSVSDLLPAVHRDIDRFVKNAPQFDDITMLALSMKNKALTGEGH